MGSPTAGRGPGPGRTPEDARPGVLEPGGGAVPKAPTPVITAGGRLTIDRITPDQLVTVGGRLGVFTPLTTPDAGDPASTTNLQAIVDVLRKQVVELQSTNAALTAKLTAAEQASTSADDFAAGIQHAVDGLQDKLATMQNSVSTFGVREFSMQTKVLVDVSQLGAIGLRFVAPGESVDASALSTVSLTLVPLPKEQPAQAAPAPADLPVDQIDGLSGDQIATLHRAHVTTTSSFRRAATRATTAATLRGMLAVDRESLGRMTELAGLLGVPGIDRISAAVLHSAGITDPATLATTTAKDLVRRYRAAARRRKDAGESAPSEALAQQWIDAAVRLTGHGTGA